MIGHTIPEVDDRLAVDHDADRCAELTALCEVALELLAYAFEAGVAAPVHRAASTSPAAFAVFAAAGTATRVS